MRTFLVSIICAASLVSPAAAADKIVLMLNSDSYYSDPYPPNPMKRRRARLRGPESTNPAEPKWPPEGYNEATLRCVSTRQLFVRDKRH